MLESLVLLFRLSVSQLASSTETNCFNLSKYWLYSSTSLWPAPYKTKERNQYTSLSNKFKRITSTHKGSTALGHLSWMAMPWEKSITSSSVPWMTRTGDVTLETLSILYPIHYRISHGWRPTNHSDDFQKYLGKASKHQVRCVLGKATRIPDMRGECRMTAPTSYLIKVFKKSILLMSSTSLKNKKMRDYLEARSTVGTVPILWP